MNMCDSPQTYTHDASVGGRPLQIEVPEEPERLQRIRARLRERYPVAAFNLVRCVRACVYRAWANDRGVGI